LPVYLIRPQTVDAPAVERDRTVASTVCGRIK